MPQHVKTLVRNGAALVAFLACGALHATTLTVNSLGDDVAPADSLVTLREAIIPPQPAERSSKSTSPF